MSTHPKHPPAYPIANLDHEFERLQWQADFWAHDAEILLDKIGIQPGWRCLDMCSGLGGITRNLARRTGSRGEVVGLDHDPEKIAFATAIAKAHRTTTINFVEGDAFSAPFDEGYFDLAHCRFTLGVIGHGQAILQQMIRVTKPGGWVLAQEVDLGPASVYPPNEAWSQVVALCQAVFTGVGADISTGRQLPRLFQQADLADIGIRPSYHVVLPGASQRAHLQATLASMRDAALALHLVDDAELDRLLAAANAHTAQASVVMYSPAIIQVWGRRPP